MDSEQIAVILGAVIPLYPVLFSIHQKIGKYDLVCLEFAALQDEHAKFREKFHGR
jgi:hypothetical protein